MKLRKPGHFEFAPNATRQLAKRRGDNARVEFIDLEQLFGVAVQANQFSANDAFVELDVVPHKKTRTAHVSKKAVHGLVNRDAFFQGPFRRNTMDLLCIVRNVEPVGPHYIIMPGEQPSPVVVELPRDLHQPGPVVEIRNRGGLVVGYSGSFSVEYQVHPKAVNASQDGKITVFSGNFPGKCSGPAGPKIRPLAPKLTHLSFY